MRAEAPEFKPRGSVNFGGGTAGDDTVLSQVMRQNLPRRNLSALMADFRQGLIDGEDIVDMMEQGGRRERSGSQFSYAFSEDSDDSNNPNPRERQMIETLRNISDTGTERERAIRRGLRQNARTLARAIERSTGVGSA